MLIVDRPWTLPAPSAGATNLLLVTFLIPVSAILFGTTLLGERLAARHFLGMALIGCGLAAIGRERAAAPPAASCNGQIPTCRLLAPLSPRSAKPSGGRGRGGGGWARREGDENDAAAGPGQPSTAAPYRRRSASGKHPHPARALPESALACFGRRLGAS